MNGFLENLFPNLFDYMKEFQKAVTATWQMFWLAGILSFLIGLCLGVILEAAKPSGIRRIKACITSRMWL